MIIQLKYYIGVLVIVLSVSACKKYLDVVPDNSLVIPSTPGDAQLILDNTTQINNLGSPFYGEWSADNYYLPDDLLETKSALLSFNNVYTWENNPFADDATTDPANDAWSYTYKAIALTNSASAVVKDLPLTPESSTAINNVKGSALAFRAYFFWKLATTFSKAYNASTAQQDMGIPLRVSEDFNDKVTRASVQQTYDQIIDDLKSSIHMLPLKAQFVTRPSKLSVYGILSEVYLSMRKYDQALLYADSALAINSSLLDYNTLNSQSLTPFPSAKDNPEILQFFACFNGPYTFQAAAYAIDTALYASYNNKDLRKQNFFAPNAYGYYFKGSYYGSRSINFTGPTTAEMYLIRAECLARNGSINEAMKTLNTLLINRYVNTSSDPFMPLTAATPVQALQIVLDNRRKELVFREKRWIDIKRLNLENANIILKRKINGQVLTLQPNANRYAIPLPPSVIQISGIPQNPQ